MAIWQYDLRYFPNKQLGQMGKSVPCVYDSTEWYNESERLNFDSPPINVTLKYLDGNAPQLYASRYKESWAPSSLYYKDSEETYLRISSKSVFSLSDYSVLYRVDLRCVKDTQLEFALLLASFLDASLYDFATVFPATEDYLMESLRSSRAYRFCIDPDKTLLESRRNSEPEQ